MATDKNNIESKSPLYPEFLNRDIFVWWKQIGSPQKDSLLQSKEKDFDP